MGLFDQIADGASSAFGKALGVAGTVASDSLSKASQAIVEHNRELERQHTAAGQPEPPKTEPKALAYDPFAIIDQLGYKDRPSGITYNTLSEMVRRVPIVGSIIQTRVIQVANFAIPQEHERDPGFRVMLREKKRSPTKVELKEILETENWIQNTGSTRRFGKDTFESFLRKFARDSMTYDQGNSEIVYNRKDKPSDFYAVDAATMRVADVPLGAELDDDPNRVRFVQVYDEVVIAEFAAHEMIFGVRNPRTGVRLNGYGVSETEMLLTIVTSLLHGMTYNAKFFTQGSVPKGILNFKGSVPDSKLEAFRRQWTQQITGVANAWRTPITNSDELQYINMQVSNRDMEFLEWMNWLTKVTCAMFQMDPQEINFAFGNTGQTSQVFSSPVEEKMRSSKSRGLVPILRAIAGWLNQYLVWRLNEDLVLKFTGVDAKDSEEIIDAQKKQVTYLKTVDEIRAENDLQPLPDGKGAVLLDPTWLQYSQMKDAEKQQEELAAQAEAQGLPPAMPGQMPGQPPKPPTNGVKPPQPQAAAPEQGPPPIPAGVKPESPTAEKSLARIRETSSPKTVTYEIEL